MQLRDLRLDSVLGEYLLYKVAPKNKIQCKEDQQAAETRGHKTETLLMWAALISQGSL